MHLIPSTPLPLPADTLQQIADLPAHFGLTPETEQRADRLLLLLRARAKVQQLQSDEEFARLAEILARYQQLVAALRAPVVEAAPLG
ncbi:MAG: hypothetical protein OHK0039_22110 [Bacteroidia bacterium]